MSSSQRPLVVKIINGRVALYSSSGNYLRSAASNAVSAVIQGDQVHVTRADGSVRIFTTAGTYVRTV
jgi:hypothetical protein